MDLFSSIISTNLVIFLLFNSRHNDISLIADCEILYNAKLHLDEYYCSPWINDFPIIVVIYMMMMIVTFEFLIAKIAEDYY